MTYLVDGMHRLEKRNSNEIIWEVSLSDNNGMKLILQLLEKPNFNPGDHVSLAIGKVNA